MMEQRSYENKTGYEHVHDVYSNLHKFTEDSGASRMRNTNDIMLQEERQQLGKGHFGRSGATQKIGDRYKSTRSTFPKLIFLLSFLSITFQSMLLPVNAIDIDDQLASFDNQNDLKNILSEKREQLLSFANQHIIQPMKQQYDTLSPKGKFFSTAFVGFTTSRVTVKSTIRVAKYAGAAFIV